MKLKGRREEKGETKGGKRRGEGGRGGRRRKCRGPRGGEERREGREGERRGGEEGRRGGEGRGEERRGEERRGEERRGEGGEHTQRWRSPCASSAARPPRSPASLLVPRQFFSTSVGDHLFPGARDLKGVRGRREEGGGEGKGEGEGEVPADLDK
jgi:hypothetical protein